MSSPYEKLRRAGVMAKEMNEQTLMIVAFCICAAFGLACFIVSGMLPPQTWHLRP